MGRRRVRECVLVFIKINKVDLTTQTHFRRIVSNSLLKISTDKRFRFFIHALDTFHISHVAGVTGYIVHSSLISDKRKG